jgi:tight adherence protein B
MSLLVALLLAVAVGLAGPGSSRLPRPDGSRYRLRSGARSPVLLLAGSALIGLLVVGLPPDRVVLATILLASVADVARRGVRRRSRAAAAARAGLVLATCDAIAADLRAGLPPVTALGSAAATWSEFDPVAHAARLGSDVPDALRALAALPGARPLRVVGAAWQVAHRNGAGLADALQLAGRTIREERATAEVVGTEMAAARATALLLAVLPLGVLLLGSGFGGDPIGFLLDTVPGLVCLALGLGLIHAGLAWLDLIATSVER